MNSKQVSIECTEYDLYRASYFASSFLMKFKNETEYKEFLKEHPDAYGYEVDKYEHVIDIYIHPTYHVEAELCDKIKAWAESFTTVTNPDIRSINEEQIYDYGENVTFEERDCTYVRVIIRTNERGKPICMNDLLKILMDYGDVII